MRVLVVGGTGQTGPLVVQHLLDTGWDVTVLHGGMHERGPTNTEHIHVDAHFQEPLAEALAGRTFDLVVAMYGRTRLVAEVVAKSTERFIAVTGSIYAWHEPRHAAWGPAGISIANEESPFTLDREIDRLSSSVAGTETSLRAFASDGAFELTILRYPEIYGPDGAISNDWSIVRRILDNRRQFVVADSGLCVRSRSYRDNAAHAVNLAIDNPAVANGQAYNVADDAPYLTRGQIVTLMANALEHDWELVSMPSWLVEKIHRNGSVGFNRVVDIQKIKDELGYQDVVSAPEAIIETARWWSNHPPERGGELETKMADSFDYAAEDELILRYQEAMRSLARLDFLAPELTHAYRHPTKPGEQWDKTSAARVMSSGTETAPFTLWKP